MPKKRKPNGFCYFMNYIKKTDIKAKTQCKNIQMLSQYCDSLWREMNHEEKQKFKEAAKKNCNDLKNISLEQLNNKMKFQNESIFTTYSTNEHSSPPRQLHLSEKIKQYISECKNVLIANEVDRWNTMNIDTFLDRETFILIDIQCYEDIPYPNQFINNNHYKMDIEKKMLHPPHVHSDYMTLNKINCIPVEISIVEYNLIKGLVSCYHDYIYTASYIPVGFMSRVKYCVDETHRIPIDGINTTSIDKVLHYINHISSRSRSNVFYCRSSHWNNISQSLNWFKHMLKSNVCDIPKVIDFFDLLENLQRFLVKNNIVDCHTLNLAASHTMSKLYTVPYEYMFDIQCPFHREFNCCYCSLKHVLAHVHALTEIFAKNLNITITIPAHYPTASFALNKPFTNIPIKKSFYNVSQRKSSENNNNQSIVKQTNDHLINPLSKISQSHSTDSTDSIATKQKLTNFDLFRY